MANPQHVNSLIQVIEAIADNKYILGDRLVEVGVSGPDLEASLSAIAMAQAELGHSRLLYNWKFSLEGFKGKKPEVSSQTGKAFDSVLKIDHWITLIAGLYSVNVSFDILMKTMIESDHPDVVSNLTKLLKEQSEHIAYSKGWSSKLLNESGSIPQRFREALEKVNVEVTNWLQTVEENSDLSEEGYLMKNANLVEKFKGEMNGITSGEATVNA